MGKRALILGGVLLVVGFIGAVASQVIMNLAADSMGANGFVLVLVIAIMFGLPILLTMLAVDLIGGFVVGLYAAFGFAPPAPPQPCWHIRSYYGIAARRLAAGLRGLP